MAQYKDLPTYNRPGIQTGEIPGYNYADMQEAHRLERAQTTAFDALTTWAYDKATKHAIAEGEQYAAQNPVTSRQLTDGTAQVADKGTYFGDAARKLQIEGLATDVGIEATSRMNEFGLRAKAGDIDIPNAERGIKDIIDGYAASLGQIDPHASNRFRAAASTHGNSLLMGMREAAAKRAEGAQKVVIENWLADVVPSQVRAHIEAGETVDPETGASISPTQRIALMRAQMVEAVTRTGDPEFARVARRIFEDAVNKARKDTLEGYVLSEEFSRGGPLAAYDRMMKGDLGRYTNLWKNDIDENVRESTRQHYMKSHGERHQLTEQQRKDDERSLKTELDNMLIKFWPMPEGPAKRALAAQIAEKGKTVLSFDQIHTLLKKPADEGHKEPKDNYDVERQLDYLRERSGVANVAELARLVPGATPRQLAKQQDLIISADNRRLEREVKTQAGIPDGLVQWSGDNYRRKALLDRRVEELKTEQIQATAKPGKPGYWDVDTIIAKVRKDRDDIVKERDAETAKAQLAAFGRKYNKTVNDDTPVDELRRLKISDKDIEEIVKAQKTIRTGFPQ